MKTIVVFCTALVLIIVLCSCGDNDSGNGIASESSTLDWTAAIEIPDDEDVYYEGVAADLRTPAWYTRMDGSTACIPLANLIVRRMTGCDADTAAQYLKFNTTNYVTAILARSEDDYNAYGAAWSNTDKEIALLYESEDLLESRVLEYHPIGSDGLVFLVNTNNPVGSITVEQARDIFSGKITNWKQLGGENKPIVAFIRDAESGSGVMMEKLVMQGEQFKDFPEEFIAHDMGGLISDVADYRNDGNAIGYSVYYYIKNMYGSPDIKLLKINGVEPTIETISTDEYPLINDFYVAIRKSASETSAARVLMNWILSDEGRQTVIDAGYAAK